MKTTTIATALIVPIMNYVTILAAAFLRTVLLNGAPASTAATQMVGILAKSLSLGHLLVFCIWLLPVLVSLSLLRKVKGPRVGKVAFLWRGTVSSVILSLLPLVFSLLIFGNVYMAVFVGVLCGVSGWVVCWSFSRPNDSESHDASHPQQLGRSPFDTSPQASARRSFGRRMS